MAGNEIDIDAFLAQPLTAGSPPTDPALAMVIDQCDLTTGVVRQVTVRRRADLVPFDVPRGHRKLASYLGADETNVVTRTADRTTTSTDGWCANSASGH